LEGDCAKKSLMINQVKHVGDVAIVKNYNSIRNMDDMSIKTKNPINSTYTKRLDLHHLNELLENWQFRQSILPDFGFNHTQPSAEN